MPHKVTLVSPQVYSSNPLIEISAFHPNEAYKRELAFIFPTIDLSNLIVCPTMQKTLYDMVTTGVDVESEKDKCLETFFKISKEICEELISKGYWADYIDPCSGLPMITPDTQKVFDEVQSATSLLSYPTMNTGCCKVLLHQHWGSNVYPATFFTTAPSSVLIPMITPLIAGVISPAALAKLQKEEEEMFISLHEKSRAISEDAKKNLLGGVPMPWMNRLPGSFPLCVDEAKGAGFRDADGIEYIDLCLGDTGAMTGHAVEQVADAISDRARRGITTMMPSSDAGWVAGELANRFKLPLWQMAMTATDANRFVLRYARHITGRSKIVVMDWCYHGTVDETLAILAEDGTVQPRPGNCGPQCPVSETTRVGKLIFVF